MVVYEKCDPNKRKCKSPEVINEAISASYLVVFENKSMYKHQEQPGSDESISSSVHVKWYGMSSVIRQDFPKLIKVTNVFWEDLRLGIGVSFDQRTKTVYEAV